MEKAQKEGCMVRIKKPVGNIEVGGNELLPHEQTFSFGDLKDRLESLDRKNIYTVLFAIFPDGEAKTKVPIVIEIGRESNVGVTSMRSPLNDVFAKRFEHMIDVNIFSILNAGGDQYVQCSIEKLSTVFTSGHRCNFMFMSNVLTNDSVAVRLESAESKQCVLQEIYKSLMPDGLVVIHNYSYTRDALDDADFTGNGFEILFQDINTDFTASVVVLKKVTTSAEDLCVVDQVE
jgi:hypothetical protein